MGYKLSALFRCICQAVARVLIIKDSKFISLGEHKDIGEQVVITHLISFILIRYLTNSHMYTCKQRKSNTSCHEKPPSWEKYSFVS